VAIEVLSSQSFERLRDDPDRTKLKATLQQKLDAALDGYQVRDVLFTAFVMQ
jgi:flagellar basal body-associated protein FliL